mgnify:CR=1 FL=1
MKVGFVGPSNGLVVGLVVGLGSLTATVQPRMAMLCLVASPMSLNSAAVMDPFVFGE